MGVTELGGHRERRVGATIMGSKLRIEAFDLSQAESSLVPFEEKEGMEGEHTPETDLTRCHQVLEEGDKF